MQTSLTSVSLVGALLVLLLIPVSVSAFDFFHTRGGHSLTAVFGKPAPIPLTKAFSGSSNSLFLLTGGHANMFAGGQVSGVATRDELLLIDGERSELLVGYFRPMTRCVSIGMELPLVAHSSGYFDSAIESWHDLFGLPNANRDDVEQDSLSIFYTDPSGRSLKMTSSTTSVGDLFVHVLRPLRCNSSSSRADNSIVRLGVKLPTGDKRVLAGSGAVDLFADISSATYSLGNRWSVRGSAGLLFTGTSDLFSNQRSLVAFGVAGVSWRFSERLSLQAQLGWHTPFFDSQLTELGRFSSQLDVGGTLSLGTTAIELAIQEDITPDTSPDIVLHVGLRRSFF